MLLSVSTTLLLSPTTSNCVHQSFQGRSMDVAPPPPPPPPAAGTSISGQIYPNVFKAVPMFRLITIKT